MKVGVVGGGSWGTTLAMQASAAGHQVVLWAHEPEVAEQIQRERRNDLFLPGFELPPMTATAELEEAVAHQELIISVVPSHVLREIWTEAGPLVHGAPLLVSATKGIETASLATMVEVLREVTPRRLHAGIAVLSGPSFATEVAARQPTAVVVAAREIDAARRIQTELSTRRFRIYTSEDLPGVEIGGAAKNVIAIASGIADGLELGINARAALITRGLAEMTRLAVAKAAQPMTLAGLAGMGDLVLTCTGDLSRNRGVGLLLGQGEQLNDIQARTNTVAEGVNSAKSCLGLARRLGVDMPITETVHAVLFLGLDPLKAVGELMERQLKPEAEHFRT